MCRCSRNCSSTMRAFPGSALPVIWYFFHTADRHPGSCDISFVHFRTFFIKTPIRVWLKASETSFPRKGRIPWGHFAWFWKGLHVYFLQIVVFVWRINACRVWWILLVHLSCDTDRKAELKGIFPWFSASPWSGHMPIFAYVYQILPKKIPILFSTESCELKN
jgi:hypothetical protein